MLLDRFSGAEMSRYFVLVVFGGLIAVSPLHQRGQQQDGRQPDARIQQLLDIDYGNLRKDAFARAKAVAKRYESSAIRGFATATAELNAYCELTEKQQRKLALAVRGTAKRGSNRFLEQVEATASIKSSEEAYGALNALLSEVRDSLADPTQSKFWQNVVQKTLTANQLDVLKKNREARAAFMKEAWVIDVVRETDRYARLQIGQRTQLRKRLRQWVQKHELPELKRSYRGPWKYVREKAAALVILDGLDDRRRDELVGIAPKLLRDALTSADPDEAKRKSIWVP